MTAGSDTTPRVRFKEAAQAAVRAARRNIDDRGVTGPDSALHVGPGRNGPGLLDVLADAAEAAYGAAPRARAKGGAA